LIADAIATAAERHCYAADSYAAELATPLAMPLIQADTSLAIFAVITPCFDIFRQLSITSFLAAFSFIRVTDKTD